MAQTGYTPILIYSSSTAAAAPAVANLTNSTLGSELAINITDGKLFYKDNANAIQVIGWKTVPTSAGGTGLTSYTAGDLIYYASGTTFTKLGIGAANTVLTSSGSAPQWSTNLNIGSLTATSISDSGNLTFTGTGNRITGDFSDATFTNRVLFQTSTTNNFTLIGAIPNGTSKYAQFAVWTGSTANESVGYMAVDGTAGSVSFGSDRSGTGTYVQMQFFVGGSERMRIDPSGFTQFPGNNVMPYQGAPTTKNAAATLSGAELITGILNTTGTTYTITLPTGTNIEGALTWAGNNVSLDWWVINTASGTITIGANGNTTLGTLTIATGVSAHFRIRRTAANTFTVYRLS